MNPLSFPNRMPIFRLHKFNSCIVLRLKTILSFNECSINDNHAIGIEISFDIIIVNNFMFCLLDINLSYFLHCLLVKSFYLYFLYWLWWELFCVGWWNSNFVYWWNAFLVWFRWFIRMTWWLDWILFDRGNSRIGDLYSIISRLLLCKFNLFNWLLFYSLLVLELLVNHVDCSSSESDLVLNFVSLVFVNVPV